MAARGLRVIAMSYRPLEAHWRRAQLEEDLIFAGLAGLEDPPRPEVPEALRKSRAAGIAVIMVTGDHPYTAKAIGREIGLVCSNDPLVNYGREIARAHRHPTTTGARRTGSYLRPRWRGSEKTDRRSPEAQGGTS
jgi:sodium/potassium-transporting ATPase subunit alpha